MRYAGKKVEVRLDLEQEYQKIDGFGVNINSKTMDGEKLLPALDLLLNDLGATLFRVDIWGKSNWIDPTGEMGPESLRKDHLDSVYSGEIFERGWRLMRFLNAKGIQPYLTASGDVPRWMLGSDGKTLTDYDSFCEMMVSLAEWAKKKEGIDFTMFGPLNETDIGSPEGPWVSPSEYTRVCEILDEKLSIRGLDDIRLVVPEQGGFNVDYISELVRSPTLQKRIAVFSMHDYLDYTPEQFRQVTDLVEQSTYSSKGMWFGEFGDLDQSGEKEWYVGWWMVSRLMDHLEAGFHASLAWDAFDNYHDHDEAWTIYGLLRAGVRIYTPKKRYYALKQVYRFVPPGFIRIAISSDSPDVRVLAFTNRNHNDLTVVGINRSPGQAYYLNVDSPALPSALRSRAALYYRTSAEENCCQVASIPFKGANYPFTGLEVYVPPESIFTLTTLEC